MIDYLKTTCAVLFFIILLCNSMVVYATTSEEWFRATSSGDTLAISYLISKKANINERGALSMTPLMLASFFGKSEAVRMLINVRADLNFKSGSGLTALMLASQKGYENIVSLLLNAGADKNIKSTSGTTALMYAKEKGFEAIIHQINATDENNKQIISLVSDKEIKLDTILEKQPDKSTLAAAETEPVLSDNQVNSPQFDIPIDSSDKNNDISLLPGVWLDPENNNNTRYSIKRINGEPRVVAASNNREVFTIEKSLWSNGILSWEYLVPSTDFRLTYKTIKIRSDNVICSWSNDHGMSGTAVLTNIHQNGESDTIVVTTKDTSSTDITTGKGIVKPLALNTTYKAYLPNGRTYVNFFSGGINIANMSDKYIDLIGQYYGAILYNLLGQQYTISPLNSYYFTWTFGAEFGLYPSNFIGINTGCFFMGKGDEVTLLKEGSERVMAEEHIYSMELPLFFRLRVPNDELSPYIDAGVSFGIFLSAKEMVGYYNSEDASQNTDWSSVNLFSAQNTDYYNHSDISFLFGIGLHFAGAMHVEYRQYYGLTNFYSQSSTLDSKCITHSFTMGFDCYYKKKINKPKDINIENNQFVESYKKN